MSLTTSGLFTLAQHRLAWVDKREQVLAENVANADTPSYRARDVEPFAAALDRVHGVVPLESDSRDLLLAATSGNPTAGGASVPADASVETNLGKLADTEGMQSLVLNLYGAYLGMFRTALGVGGGSSG